MVKKTLLVAGGALLLVGLLFGRDAASYVKTTYGWVHQSVKDSVPLTFEIDRARKMIKDLDPEIRRNMHLIAKEEVEVEKLEREVARAEAQLAKSRDEILRLNRDVESGAGSFYYGGRKYTMTQVKADLSNRFERHKTNEATSEKLAKLLNARQNSLGAARQKLEGMMAAKRQLEVDVANLEARQKMVEVAQTTSDFNFDDSHLARTKELIAEINARIDVAERLVNADTKFHSQIPLDLDGEASENLSDEIAKYFGGEGSTAQVAKSAK